MTPDQLAALKAAAEAATPGPWFRPVANDTAIRSDDVDIAQTMGAYELEWERMEADAAHIAAANPAAILSLIARMEAAEADAARFRHIREAVSIFGANEDLVYLEWSGRGETLGAAIDAAMKGDGT